MDVIDNPILVFFCYLLSVASYTPLISTALIAANRLEGNKTLNNKNIKTISTFSLIISTFPISMALTYRSEHTHITILFILTLFITYYFAIVMAKHKEHH